jgi:hypothetical protein
MKQLILIILVFQIARKIKLFEPKSLFKNF